MAQEHRMQRHLSHVRQARRQHDIIFSQLLIGTFRESINVRVAPTWDKARVAVHVYAVRLDI
jgi:hypothetical protein